MKSLLLLLNFFFFVCMGLFAELPDPTGSYSQEAEGKPNLVVVNIDGDLQLHLREGTRGVTLGGTFEPKIKPGEDWAIDSEDGIYRFWKAGERYFLRRGKTSPIEEFVIKSKAKS